MNPAPACSIRLMVRSDLEAVLALERESDLAPHWSPDDYLAAIEPDGSFLRRLALVAEAGGQFAGFAILRLLDAPAGGEAELESIIVAQKWRGCGLGAAMLLEAARRAKEGGAVRLDLEVRASNSAALRLYCRAGFAENGRRPGYYRDPEEDAVLMSATL